MSEIQDYEKTYNDFWKGIVEKDGIIDMERVKRELHDYRFILGEVPKVYCAITGNQLSKPNYPAEVVIAQFEDKNWDKEIIREDIGKSLKDYSDIDELKDYLRQYFELEKS